MQTEINAVIITDSVDKMNKIKELLRAKATITLNNAEEDAEGTRLDIDGFFINPEVETGIFSKNYMDCWEKQEQHSLLKQILIQIHM